MCPEQAESIPLDMVVQILGGMPGSFLASVGLRATTLMSLTPPHLRHQIRHSRSFTQKALAEQLPRYLAGIERGERNLTLDTVDALADDLGVRTLDPIAAQLKLRPP